MLTFTRRLRSARRPRAEQVRASVRITYSRLRCGNRPSGDPMEAAAEVHRGVGRSLFRVGGSATRRRETVRNICREGTWICEPRTRRRTTYALALRLRVISSCPDQPGKAGWSRCRASAPPVQRLADVRRLTSPCTQQYSPDLQRRQVLCRHRRRAAEEHRTSEDRTDQSYPDSQRHDEAPLPSPHRVTKRLFAGGPPNSVIKKRARPR